MTHTLESLLKLAETDAGKEQLDAMVAALSGAPKHFYICKRGLYYRPGGNGYTGSRSDAWKLPESEALTHEYKPAGAAGIEWVTLEPVEVPAYTTRLDAILPEARQLLFSQRQAYLDHLNQVMAAPIKHCVRIADREMAFAEAIHHTIAFILTKQTPL